MGKLGNNRKTYVMPGSETENVEITLILVGPDRVPRRERAAEVAGGWQKQGAGH